MQKQFFQFIVSGDHRKLRKIVHYVLWRTEQDSGIGFLEQEPRLDSAKDVLGRARARGMQCVVGGGVSKETVPFIRELPEGLVDRYETRKVIFSCPGALQDGYADGILKAVGFELMWLKNKRGYYEMIFREDEHRISMLESRYKKLIEEAGGVYE